MPGNRQTTFIGLAAGLAIVMTIVANACPYCPRTEWTLSEKLAQSEVACLAEYLSTETGDNFADQSSQFVVIESLPRAKMLKRGETIKIPIGITAQPGDQFLLMGQTEGEAEWNLPIPVDELGSELKYIRNAPALEAPLLERLAYFWKHLDSNNALIANDAFGEFSRVRFDDVKLFSTNIDRVKVRKWLQDPNPQLDVRRDFFGMVLGLCGNDDDARFLEKKVFAPISPDKNRLGIGGMMAGYLMLRGPRGLDDLIARKIDAVPLSVPSADPRISEMNEVRHALKFLWDYRREQFSDELLRVAMRKILNRPEYAELAIFDLSKWKDWASLEPLLSAYGRDPWETLSAKEKIVAFALSCLRDVKANPGAERARYQEKAESFLSTLDPEFVKSVRQSFTELANPEDSAKESTESKNSSN